MTKNEQSLTFFGGLKYLIKKANTLRAWTQSTRFILGVEKMMVSDVDRLSVFPRRYALGYPEGAIEAAECCKSALDRNGKNAVLGVCQEITRSVHFQGLNVSIEGHANVLRKIPRNVSRMITKLCGHPFQGAYFGYIIL